MLRLSHIGLMIIGWLGVSPLASQIIVNQPQPWPDSTTAKTLPEALKDSCSYIEQTNITYYTDGSKQQEWYDSCHQARPFCGSSIYTMVIGGTQTSYIPFECCPGDIPWNCCAYYWCDGQLVDSNPRWFFTRIEQAGTIKLLIQTNPSKNIDFMCYGPFNTPTGACIEGITQENVVDCSSSWYLPDTCIIPNGQPGEFYLLMLTSPTTFTTLSFQQVNIGQPGAGSTTCDIVTNCDVLTLSATPSECNTALNTYSVAGELSFVNPPLTGLLVVYDNSGNSISIPAPFTSPISYTIPDITCDGLIHTVTASFWDSAYCELATPYNAPILCPDATISGGGNICNKGLSEAQLSIAFTPNAELPYTFSWKIDGVPQAPIVNYAGTVPYTFLTSVPGVYTMNSSFNANCYGQLNGQAIVNILPNPLLDLGEDISACFGQTITLDAGLGFANYLWNTDETTQTIQVNDPGIYTVVVTDANACQASDTITVQFQPQIQPLQIKHN